MLSRAISKTEAVTCEIKREAFPIKTFPRRRPRTASPRAPSSAHKSRAGLRRQISARLSSDARIPCARAITRPCETAPNATHAILRSRYSFEPRRDRDAALRPRGALAAGFNSPRFSNSHHIIGSAEECAYAGRRRRGGGRALFE
ncbi:hypothetical protein EVAR_22927_1 [Eumeta japonica]|uniref:Uncharacterized protein n=1 Tax=Eumeta variegata TaxID=151549 RepID=A0A4C1UUB2_EUMVA|nr:hypothetical protein EVAR_22927_1 [Eumeta japonica]